MGLYLSRYLSWYLGEPKGAPAAPQSQLPRPRRQRAALRAVQPGGDDAGAGAQRAVAAQARRGSPGRQTSSVLSLTAEFSYARLNHLKCRLWDPGDPRVQGLVPVQVNPTVCPESLYKCPQPEGRQDPRAKETVLQALSQCKKGQRKFDVPLWFEMPDPKIRELNPEPRPSAFHPVTRNTVARSFVPRPGLLSRSCAQGNPATGRGKMNVGLPTSLPLTFPLPAQPGGHHITTSSAAAPPGAQGLPPLPRGHTMRAAHPHSTPSPLPLGS